jgi:protoporphyrin/coproporphyrin ferrochelatase
MKFEDSIGVLLMALGGPDSLEAVGPYLKELRGGRPTPVELIDEIKERYRVTGGKSPVLGITTELADKLGGRLSASGLPAKVYVGFRHWHPLIGDVCRRMEAEGVRRVVGVCMAPQNSQLTVGAYIRKVEDARAQSGTPSTFTYVRSWNTHPRLIDAIAVNIETTRRRFPPDSKVALLFTAHSLPSRIVQDGDTYPQEVQATVDAVVARVRPDVWKFAYQSQGRSEEPWLGPTLEAALEELDRGGHRGVLVAPIGFVSDHVEILYDIDLEFQKLATQKGMQFERIPMLNASSPLVDTLADVIHAHLQETGSLAPA